MDTHRRPPLDLAAALEYAGGDEELFRELLEIFLTDCPPRLDDLREAAATGAPPAVMRAAHGLKGSLRALGATAAADLAERLEQMGRAGDLHGVTDCLEAFEEALDVVVRACLREHRAGPSLSLR